MTLDRQAKLKKALKLYLEVEKMNCKLSNELASSALDKKNGYEFTCKAELIGNKLDKIYEILKSLI